MEPMERYERDSPEMKAAGKYISDAIREHKLFFVEGFVVQEGRSQITKWHNGDDFNVEFDTGVVFLLLGGTVEERGGSVFLINTEDIDAFIEALQSAKVSHVASLDDPGVMTATHKFNQQTGE